MNATTTPPIACSLCGSPRPAGQDGSCWLNDEGAVGCLKGVTCWSCLDEGRLQGSDWAAPCPECTPSSERTIAEWVA